MSASAGAAEMGARGEAGFTLVEMLVAFVIMAAMATMLYRGLSSGLGVAGIADGEEAALLVAKARLAAAGVESPLQAGEQDGSDGDVSWHLALRPYVGQGGSSLLSAFELPSLQSLGQAQQQQPPPLQAFWATVTVSWRPPRGARRRSLSLTTIKLGHAP
jgi:general secretion pathway protein I